MSPRLFAWLLAGVAGALPVGVLAQEQPVVVTASRVGVAGATPFPTQVIGPGELAARESVADALALRSDVYVQAPGGRSGTGAIFLRGADPNFTTVFFDGIPLNNPGNQLGGAVNVSELPAAGLDRIELVTGALSSLYGSGALAGAVNVIVPGGAGEHELHARGAIGTADTQAGLLQWRGPVAGSVGGSLALAHEQDETVSPSRFRTTTLFGKLAEQGSADRNALVFRLASTRSDTFPESSGGDRLAVIRTLEQRRGREALLGGRYDLLEQGGTRLMLAGSYLYRRDRTVTPGVAPSDFSPDGVPGGEDETRLSRFITQAIARHDAAQWSVAAGAEAQHEDARSTGFLDFGGFAAPSGFDGDRWTGSAFAEGEWRASTLTVNAGLRLDKVEGLDARLTGRGGVTWRLGDSGLALRGNYGTAFKAPSFYALGNPFVGNPALAPERSRTIEAGIGYTADPVRLDLVSFHARYSQLIDFVFDPAPQLVNRARVTSEGVTLSAAATPVSTLSLSAQLTYAETRDADTDELLLNRPRWSGAARIGWEPTEQLTLAGSYRHTGSRRAFSIPSGPAELGAFDLVSAEAAWAFSPALSLRLVLDNAFDTQFEHAVGVASPGRRARFVLAADL